MNDKRLYKLFDLCKAFITEQKINCPENIYQSDCVILNAHEFIEKICDIVGYYNETNDISGL